MKTTIPSSVPLDDDIEKENGPSLSANIETDHLSENTHEEDVSEPGQNQVPVDSEPSLTEFAEAAPAPLDPEDLTLFAISDNPGMAVTEQVQSQGMTPLQLMLVETSRRIWEPRLEKEIHFEEKVITRLVELSQDRQVLVFTHRLSFLGLMTDIGGEELHDIHISREDWGTGEPSGVPIFAKNPLGALKNLKNEGLARAAKMLREEGGHLYYPLAKS